MGRAHQNQKWFWTRFSLWQLLEESSETQYLLSLILGKDPQ